MNADVLIWGPVGSLYLLGRKGGPSMTQHRWRDLPDAELEDAINWVIEEGFKGPDPIGTRVYIYTNTWYAPPGQTIKIGKNQAGGGTMFHYMIVSDEKIESEDQAAGLVREALEGGETDGEDRKDPVDTRPL